MQTKEWFEAIPKLGFGLMRLPGTQGGGQADLETVTKMVDAFMDAGLRYFDTAYVYDKGGSEKAVKTVLVDRYPRDSFLLATKRFLEAQGLLHDNGADEYSLTEKAKTIFTSYYLEERYNRSITDFLYSLDHPAAAAKEE